MNNYLKLIQISLILFTCSGCIKSQDKGDFIGTWESIEKDKFKMILTINYDTLNVKIAGNDIFHSDWIYDDTAIYSKNVKINDSLFNDSPDLRYQFSKDKDTLAIRRLAGKSSEFRYFVRLPIFETTEGEYSFEKNWEYLSGSMSGCLVGGQNCYNGKCGGEGCCFDEDLKWKKFFEQDSKKLTLFLITQLADTSQSKTHVCPRDIATKGELAVYALQRIHKLNWYDLDSKYYKYNDGTLEAGKDYLSEQDELQNELADSVGLKLITQKWMEKLKQMK